MKCPRCQQENPPRAKFCLECGVPVDGIIPGPRSSADSTAEIEGLRRSLSEALEQQTATSDILRVISQSHTDVQPVFDTIITNAVRLCETHEGSVFRFDGHLIHLVASETSDAEFLEALHRVFPRVPGRDSPTARAILTGTVIHVPDITAEPSYNNLATMLRTARRTILSVPMLRDGQPIGAITVARRDVQPFSDRQIALLKTFADQAVIAIENVRLFNETKEALEQQTATSEILRVISSSPTDVQPIFDAIVRSASRLCGGEWAIVTRYDGELLHLAAQHNPRFGAADATSRFFPHVPRRETSIPARALVDGAVVHVSDVETEDLDLSAREQYRRIRLRAVLAVPMVHEGRPIGVVAVSRGAPGLFSDRQVDLLRTFADQAVIAIENVRLFTELQEKNRALTKAHGQVTEALEQQTATSEILRVISGVHTNTQPVFDTIVQSAVRLCKAATAAVFLTDGRMLYEPANYGSSPEVLAVSRARYPRPLNMDTTGGIAVLTRSVVHVPDTEDPLAIEWIRQSGRLVGFRSVVTVPMLREGDAVGAILVTRRQPGPFSDTEVELLKTFADQAVIAVENVRLFKELEARTAALTRSVEQLTALGDVGRALSSTLDLDTVLQTIVTRASQLSGTDACSVFEYDEATEAFRLRATNNLDEEVVALARQTPTRKGEGVQGRMAITRQPVQVPDIAEEDAYRGPLRDVLLRTGTRAVLAVPMLCENKLIGGLTVNKRTPGEFSPEVIELLTTFATQSSLAIHNARLFREIEIKSRQLEVASQHKSEFLANMSHELRTPLNAIIGFSEVLSERMFGDLNAKQDEYLKDIHASGQHLLSLINDILDLSKIEAGRMELELTDFHVPAALDNALTLVRERTGRRGIALHMTTDERLDYVRADERKVRQVVLNLLSNAIKFTPEGGRIEVRVKPAEGAVEVSVTDTGVGIAPEDQEAIFEEFRQVGTAAKKVEGTGLGLALSRKFVELHGGKIWVQSQVGAGSTFTFTIPMRS